MRKLIITICFSLFSFFAIAQNSMQGTEMADLMRDNGKIYVVVAVLTLIFIGIILFLINLDRKIKRLEDDL